mmetsp:Transcript_23999/g.66689  ORF Transcript_23999/g.66689 Transcript_23999/m.66689 type:complete len:1007 (-) Transcript_23999:341-3361(-)|eukprot:CAMPEP_0117682908 /NCGR_PEP_ID=MMETSP0804-20121206/20007_1 /TAXON_ID=1074897 /ORGANISM="Tetraselmis astigmatica, Strain CCMP880" /LENGTH=1006 /DNA_ID=CAMNT_0005493245 /DNA_START=66 /DNA_END=3086 /DNA_ORIENTATION=-
MNIIEEWDLDAADRYGDMGDALRTPTGVTDASSEPMWDGGGLSGSQLRERPIFSVEVVERNIARGRGSVSAVAAASDCIVVGTSRGYLLRYDFSQGTTPVAEIELSKAANSVVSVLFVDSAANHVIACISNDIAVENHYVHAKWKKSRLMSKLKGVTVTAVGWSEGQVSEQSTGPVLIGTSNGVLGELLVEERDKREKHFKHLYSVGDAREPICSVALTQSPGRMVAMAVTPTRFFLFVGSGTLEAMFAACNARKTPMLPAIELPGDSNHISELHFQIEANQFLWLAQPGIYQGQLALSSIQQEDKPNTADLIAGQELLSFPESARPGDSPLSMAVTEYHLLLLYKTKLLAINQVNRQVIQEVPLAGAAARGLAGVPLGLSVDAASQTVFMYTGEALHEVSIRDEGRDMWKIHLARGDYEQAAAHCFSSEQRNAVQMEQAEAAFVAGDFQQAARLFARLDAPKPTFEQTALRFVEIGDPSALYEFLRCKLEALASDDRAQATMVATWLTELQLDQINRALLDDQGETGPECQSLIEQLREFLTQYKDVLDNATTSSLLASYGRLDELMHFAAMNEDSETVIEHLMQRGEVKRALGVLRRPNTSLELVYKFAPVLLAAVPGEAVDSWIHAADRLDPRRLMPALLRSDEPGATAAVRAAALRYIEYCFRQLECDDTALHNLAVSLYSSQDDEGSLLAYMEEAKGPLGRPLYDEKFALRLARERNRARACVQLLSDMGMFQDATILALKEDVELAKKVAERPEDDAPLRRKLWLTIARNIVESKEGSTDQGNRIRQAVAFLKETGGLLKIEDILPFFPDFVLIDEFKDAICTSLEEYNRQIDELKSEMDGATEIAEALRKDLAGLENRTAVVDLSSPCERCGRSLASGPPPPAGPSGGCQKPFYVFPCGSLFHTPCLVEEVAQLVGPTKGAALRGVAARLAAVVEGATTAAAWEGQPPESVATLLRQLEAQAASECPRCGEIVVRLLDIPLVQDAEAEVASWAITREAG